MREFERDVFQPVVFIDIALQRDAHGFAVRVCGIEASFVEHGRIHFFAAVHPDGCGGNDGIDGELAGNPAERRGDDVLALAKRRGAARIRQRNAAESHAAGIFPAVRVLSAHLDIRQQFIQAPPRVDNIVVRIVNRDFYRIRI